MASQHNIDRSIEIERLELGIAASLIFRKIQSLPLVDPSTIETNETSQNSLSWTVHFNYTALTAGGRTETVSGQVNRVPVNPPEKDTDHVFCTWLREKKVYDGPNFDEAVNSIA